MTLDEIIANVKQKAEGRTRHDAIPRYEAELLVAEIERLRRVANHFRVGLELIAENPEWQDHSTRAAYVLAREHRLKAEDDEPPKKGSA